MQFPCIIFWAVHRVQPQEEVGDIEIAVTNAFV